MIEIIKNEHNLVVYIPMEDIADTDIQQLMSLGTWYGLDKERGIKDDVEYNLVYFNSIEEDILQLFLSKGYYFEWLKMANYPYAEIDKDADTGDLYIYENGVFENDTNKLIRIYKDSGSELNPGYPTSVEINEWADKFGIDVVYTSPDIIKEKMKDYIDNK